MSFPTETFYGLAADAFNVQALEKIFKVKKRSTSKPLLLIISSVEQLTPLVQEIPAKAQLLINAFWPGPLTIIFKAKSHIPELLTGKTGTIGIRISSHPVAQELSECFQSPVTGTSANISGGKNPSTADEVETQIGHGLDLILDGGKTHGQKGSTIIDVTAGNARIIRQGDIPAEEIQTVLLTKNILPGKHRPIK